MMILWSIVVHRCFIVATCDKDLKKQLQKTRRADVIFSWYVVERPDQ